SARAAAWALREAGAARVSVWNRTAGRARELAGELGVEAVEGPLPGFDLLVNCTAVGLAEGSDQLKDLPVDDDALNVNVHVVDLVYAPGGTSLVARARAHGAGAVDGLEVLVRQGALSLERWTGVTAPLEVMRRAARGE
ncbi:MAG TPA: shikimate dehydrogenase, partial [Solirubrobacteraceae bacterium]|nr:shikimate dehydrogenase [Solirubrobacteraceae bacterium]